MMQEACQHRTELNRTSDETIIEPRFQHPDVHKLFTENKHASALKSWCNIAAQRSGCPFKAVQTPSDDMLIEVQHAKLTKRTKWPACLLC